MFLFSTVLSKNCQCYQDFIIASYPSKCYQDFIIASYPSKYKIGNLVFKLNFSIIICLISYLGANVTLH